LVGGAHDDLDAELAAREPVDAGRHRLQRAHGARDQLLRRECHEREHTDGGRDLDGERLALHSARVVERVLKNIAIGCRRIEQRRQRELVHLHLFERRAAGEPLPAIAAAISRAGAQ